MMPSLRFEPRDLWVGVYWDRISEGEVDVYVCVVPTLPLCFNVDTSRGLASWVSIIVGLARGGAPAVDACGALRAKWITFRSVAFVTYRDWRYGGCQYALRRLAGWRVGRT